MNKPLAAIATESANGAPIAIGTSATAVHTSPSGHPDDVLLCLVNITGAAVLATVTIAGGTGLPLSVPANSQIHVGPFGCRGTVQVAAASGGAVYALASVRR